MNSYWTWYINTFRKRQAVALAQRKLKQSIGSKQLNNIEGVFYFAAWRGMVKLLLPSVAWSIGCCLFFPLPLFNPYKPRNCSCFWIPWQSWLVRFFKLLPKRKRWWCLFSCLFCLLKRNTELITSGCSWRTTSFVVLLAVANFKEYVISGGSREGAQGARLPPPPYFGKKINK